MKKFITQTRRLMIVIGMTVASCSLSLSAMHAPKLSVFDSHVDLTFRRDASGKGDFRLVPQDESGRGTPVLPEPLRVRTYSGSSHGSTDGSTSEKQTPVVVVAEGQVGGQSVSAETAEAIKATVAAVRHAVGDSHSSEPVRPLLLQQEEHVEIIKLVLTQLRDTLNQTDLSKAARKDTQLKIKKFEQALKNAQAALRKAVDAGSAQTSPQADQGATQPKNEGGFLERNYLRGRATNRAWNNASIKLNATTTFSADTKTAKAGVNDIIAALRLGKTPEQVLTRVTEKYPLAERIPLKNLIAQIYDLLVAQKLRPQVMIDASEFPEYQKQVTQFRDAKDEVEQEPQPLKSSGQGLSFLEEEEEEDDKAPAQVTQPKMRSGDTVPTSVQPRSFQPSLAPVAEEGDQPDVVVAPPKKSDQVAVAGKTGVMAQMRSKKKDPQQEKRISAILLVPQVAQDLQLLVPRERTVDSKRQLIGTIITGLRAGKAPNDVLAEAAKMIDAPNEKLLKNLLADVVDAMKSKRMGTGAMKRVTPDFLMKQWRLTDDQRAKLSMGVEDQPTETDVPRLSPAQQYRQDAMAKRRAQVDADMEAIKQLVSDNQALVDQAGKSSDIADQLAQLKRQGDELTGGWEQFLNSLDDDPETLMQKITSYRKTNLFPDGNVKAITDANKQLGVLLEQRAGYKKLVDQIKSEIAALRSADDARKKAERDAQVATFKLQIDADNKKLDDLVAKDAEFLNKPENETLKEQIAYWKGLAEVQNNLRLGLYERSLTNPHLGDDVAEAQREYQLLVQRIDNALQKAHQDELQAIFARNAARKTEEQKQEMLTEARAELDAKIAEVTNALQMNDAQLLPGIKILVENLKIQLGEAKETVLAAQARSFDSQDEATDQEWIAARTQFLMMQADILELISDSAAAYKAQAEAEAAEKNKQLGQQAIEKIRAQAAALREQAEQDAVRAKADAAKAEVQEEKVTAQQPAESAPKKPKKGPVVRMAAIEPTPPQGGFRLLKKQEAPAQSAPKESSAAATAQHMVDATKQAATKALSDLQMLWGQARQALAKRQKASVTVERVLYEDEEERTRALDKFKRELSQGERIPGLADVNRAVTVLATEPDFAKAVEQLRLSDRKAVARLWIRMNEPQNNLLPLQDMKPEMYYKNLFNVYSAEEGLSDIGHNLLARAFARVEGESSLDADTAEDYVSELAPAVKILSTRSAVYLFAQEHGLEKVGTLDEFGQQVAKLVDPEKTTELDEEPVLKIVLLMIYRDRQLLKQMFNSVQDEKLIEQAGKNLGEMDKRIFRSVFLRARKANSRVSSTEIMNGVLSALDAASTTKGIKNFVRAYKVPTTDLATFTQGLKNAVAELDGYEKMVWEKILANPDDVRKVFQAAQPVSKQSTAGQPSTTWTEKLKTFSSKAAAGAKEVYGKAAKATRQGLQSARDTMQKLSDRVGDFDQKSKESDEE